MIPVEKHFLAKVRSTLIITALKNQFIILSAGWRRAAAGEFRCIKCVAIFRLISYILFKDLKTHLIVALERHLYRPPRNNDDGGTLAKKKWIIGLRSMKCSFHVCINRTEDSGSHCAAVENHFLLCFCIIWSNRKWWKKIESVRFFQTFEGRHEWSLHSEEKSSSKNV